MKARVVSLDPGKHMGTIVVGEVQAWFSIMGTAFPVAVGDEVDAIMGKDSTLRPYARLVAPLPIVYEEMRANGLLTDVAPEKFSELAARVFDEIDPPEGLDVSDMLAVLFMHYGESDAGLDRSIRDRVLVLCDSHEVPDLVRKSTEALAKDLGVEVKLPRDAPDFNDVFDALRFALGAREERAFLLPMGHNETAIVVRKKIISGKLRLFLEAQSTPLSLR